MSDQAKFILGIFSVMASGHLLFAGVQKETENVQKPDAWQNATSFTKRLDQATIGTMPIDPMNPPPLAIWLLSFSSGQLVVHADYFHRSRTKITLHGRKIKDPTGDARRFYPYARLEVWDENDRAWRIIGNSPKKGEGVETTAVMVRVLAGKADRNESCVIDMDPFRPFVGKFRLGRVVLKDGGASQTLALSDLLPPKNAEAKQNRGQSLRSTCYEG
jgi:hypothetical protein